MRNVQLLLILQYVAVYLDSTETPLNIVRHLQKVNYSRLLIRIYYNYSFNFSYTTKTSNL